MLSIVIPVHGVAEHLGECLDSVLRHPTTRLEVIAVDDASPDHSAAILKAYAARDRRLRVVTLTRNAGLSAARNTGLAAATGDHVWFVDGDDWLLDGSVRAVLDTLDRTGPDVLIVDYARYHPDGRVRPNPTARLFHDLPETFTLDDRPELLRSLHIACNKVVRRSFLTSLEFQFHPGWYEDVSFSIPLMLAAARLTVLDRVCYAYRQRPTGSITQTVSHRHLELFAHWEQVFAFMDRHGHATLRPLVFHRMIWHCLTVLGHPNRVPRHLRRNFFTRLTQLFRTHRPSTGYRHPPGLAGLKHRLVQAGAYRTFELRTLRAQGSPPPTANREVATPTRPASRNQFGARRSPAPTAPSLHT